MASWRSNESVLIGDIEPHICPQRIKDGQMQHGTVNFFREDKGYGFITWDDGRDIFVHINDCDESVDVLTKGQRVEFEEGSNPRTGKAEAKQVNVIEASLERVPNSDKGHGLRADGSIWASAVMMGLEKHYYRDYEIQLTQMHPAWRAAIIPTKPDMMPVDFSYQPIEGPSPQPLLTEAKRRIDSALSLAT